MIVGATVVEPAPMQVMQVAIPDGLKPGMAFMVQTPSGQMQVTVPEGMQPGEMVQIQVPSAPTVTVAAAAAAPVITSHPAARGPTDPGVKIPSGPLIVGPPGPVRKQNNEKNSFGPHHHTGSPRITHHFQAPHDDGVWNEADFDRATCAAGWDPNDTLRPYLSSNSRETLNIDVEGRVQELLDVYKANCQMAVACVPCWLCFACQACCQPNQFKAGCYTVDQSPEAQILAGAAKARSLTLSDDCLIYTRSAHKNRGLRNFLGFDQYGHRFPGVSMVESDIPALSMSIPLSHLTIDLLYKTEIERANPDAFQGNCFIKPSASFLIVLRAGEGGVQVTVGCIEAGPDSNAIEFVAKVKDAIKRAPRDSPELAAAYNTWFMQKLQAAGRMAGSAPRPDQMDRGSRFAAGYAGGPVQQYVRSIGPLPADLSIVKNNWQENMIGNLGAISVTKRTRAMWSVHGNPLQSQMNAGDSIVSISGVYCEGNADHAFFDAVEQAHRANQHTAQYMEVLTTQPHYQPNYLVSVGPLDAGTLGGLGLDQKKMPPTIIAPGEMAAPSGMLPGDMVVQATIGGVVTDVTGMSGAELNMAVQSSGQPATLTVLQTARTGDAGRDRPWLPDFNANSF